MRIVWFKLGACKVTVEIQTGTEPTPDWAIELAKSKVQAALGDTFPVTGDLLIEVADNITESGGEARVEEDHILFDYKKMRLSLQASEDIMVADGWVEPGERTKVLPNIKDKPWSSLVYDLVHELGHIVDGKAPGNKYERIDPKIAPTKYGKRNSREAFAETFTYWVFRQLVNPEAESVIKEVAIQST